MWDIGSAFSCFHFRCFRLLEMQLQWNRRNKIKEKRERKKKLRIDVSSVQRV